MEAQCKIIEDDLNLERMMPEKRYLRVRYEDLVDNTQNELKKLYRFAGIPFTESTSNLAFNLTHTEIRNASEVYKGGYFMLYRGSNFKHDSWKTDLTSEVKQCFYFYQVNN